MAVSIVTLLLLDEATGEPLIAGDEPERVVVKLEGEFALTAGVQPNVNRVTIRFDEFARLGEGPAFKTLCAVEFWHTAVPAAGFQPDVSIANVRIVDVEPLEIGRPKGETNPRVIEYRLFLADARERMVAPRGGRLSAGDVNKRGTKAEDLVINSSLIALAVGAIGIALDGPIPIEVDALPPMPDLQWNGAHAPSELAKLLDYVGAAFVLTAAGTCRIELKGEGQLPLIPYGRELAAARLPGLGRRGRTVIISSAPSPVIETKILEGPSPDTFEFVVPEVSAFKAGDTAKDQFRTATWKQIDEASYFGGNAYQHTIENFKNVPQQHWYARSFAWRCIRLSEKVAPPKTSPVWRLSQLEDSTFNELMVTGQIAIQDHNGFWLNADEFVNCRPRFYVLDQQTRQPIIMCGEVLGRCAGPNGQANGTATELFPNFINLTDKQLRVQVSYEVSTPEAKKRYFTVGYQGKVDGTFEKLGEQATLLALEKGGPDVVVILRPQLRLIMFDGEEVNRTELEKTSDAIAQQYLKGSRDDCEIRTAVGFVVGELSGRTCEVRYSQEACKTTFKINAWHYPRQSIGDRLTLLEAMKEAFAGQHQTQSERTYTGGSAATQPSVPLAPGADAPVKPAASVFLVLITRNEGGEDGTASSVATYTYRCTDLAGKELAAEATPQKPRERRRIFDYGRYGIGAIDEEGNFKLIDALEVFTTGPCIPEGS